MAKFKWFRRDSGEIMLAIVIVFITFGFYVFKLSYSLILMGAKGEFTILTNFKGWQLFVYSVSPGIFLAVIAGAVLIFGLPKVLHHQERQQEQAR